MADPIVTWFVGPCHLLACRHSGQHGHLSCPECRTVGFRNGRCTACRRAWGACPPDANVLPVTPVGEMRELWRQVDCPTCHVVAGQQCRTSSGAARWEHSRRSKLAIVAYRWVGQVSHD